MEAASTVVIKVKYGDMLRRFEAHIIEEELDFSMDGLREKILSLFNIASDVKLILTYIDEDGDVVTLVDADDLRDVVKQGLNPLRITVELSSEKNGGNSSHSSGSSTPLRSHWEQQPLQNLGTGVTEILNSVPEPLRETLVKLSSDLTSKVSSSAPGIADLADYFSKVALSYLSQFSESQTRVQPSSDNDPESSSVQTETRNSDISKVNAATMKILKAAKEKRALERGKGLRKLQPEAAMRNNKPKNRDVTGRKIGTLISRSHQLKAASSALGSRDDNDTKKEEVKKTNNCYSKEKSALVFSSSPTPVSENLHLEKKLAESSCKSFIPSFVGSNLPTQGGIKEPGDAHVGPKIAHISAPDPLKPSGPAPTYKCPFPGFFNGNTLPVGVPSSQLHPFRRSCSKKDGSSTVFHRGVRCDGCGIHPIIGPRFKSKVKVDFDLCSLCFSEIGNGTDYIRMDRPAVYRNHISSKGLYDSSQAQTPLQVCSRSSKLKSCPTKLNSRFIEDLNVFDGTVMAPLTPFTKIWRMMNNGMVEWPQKTQLVWTGGDLWRNELSVELEIPAAGLLVGQELDVAVDFIAPERPGQYVSYWSLASPSGQQFGHCVWVLIQVDATLNETTLCGSIRDLNLNLPPPSSSSLVSSPEIANLDSTPVVESSPPKTENNKKLVELVEPVGEMQPNNFQEMKFPINDTLLVDSGTSSSLSAGPSVTFPIFPKLDPQSPSAPIVSAKESVVEFSGKKADNGASGSDPCAGLSVPNPIIHVHDPPPPAATEVPGKKEVEEKLLRELEEMGFKEIDLNKEILRMNEYDLGQAVDDLCNVADWDTLLEELLEMK